MTSLRNELSFAWRPRWLDVGSGIRIPIKALGFFIHVVRHILRTIHSICKTLDGFYSEANAPRHGSAKGMAGSADCQTPKQPLEFTIFRRS